MEIEKVNTVGFEGGEACARQFCEYFGGIWNEWEGGLTSVVITTAANPLMEKIHNSKKRMPFILQRNQIDTWLSDTKPEQISAVIKTFDESKMQAHTISRKLNQF